MTPTDKVFRLLLLLGFTTVVAILLPRRLKAAAMGDRVRRRDEGLFILCTLRPIAGLGAFGLFAYLINPSWMAWSVISLPNGIRWCGVAVGVLTIGWLTATLRSLGTNLTDTVVTRAGHTLVTTGPYRWVRHPFYVAVAGLVIASTLIAANWFIGLTGTLAVVLLMIRSRTEDQKLLERFGDAYASYRSQTGAFLPRRRIWTQ